MIHREMLTQLRSLRFALGVDPAEGSESTDDGSEEDQAYHHEPWSTATRFGLVQESWQVQYAAS